MNRSLSITCRNWPWNHSKPKLFDAVCDSTVVARIYCNLLCFPRAPSLILILSIRRALFSGSKAGKGSRNKVQFHDTLCNCLYVFYLHNDQNQLLLPRNGSSNLILDCVANITIPRQELFWISHNARLESDCASTSLFYQSVALSFFFFCVQFYNFTIFVLFIIGRCKLCLFFFCLFHFVF